MDILGADVSEITRAGVAFASAMAPGVLLAYYYYKQDKEKPEPKGLIILVFLLGFAIIAPAIALEVVLEDLEKFAVSETEPSSIPSYLFEAFVVAAFVEESLKLALVLAIYFRSRHFDEIMDGILYAVIASLGFACFENVFYVMKGAGPNPWAVAVLRAFTAVPMHAIASGIMGYYVGVSKFSAKKERFGMIFKGLSIAVGIHGIYNFIIFLFAGSNYFGLLEYIDGRIAKNVVAYFILLSFIAPIIIVGFFNLRNKIKIAIADDLAAGRCDSPEEIPDNLKKII